ncbi:lethal(3)malignant brain tumor-like protein 3 isoform X2 [Neodiprion virginianus]|uniref:lethal(3)malignant brain tumor-like protein 3 isoform X2 n=1 Tax=Neodiprion fabricii TaxID=2872261 RepID=UPI001ED94878|nr:lethal(3)malignant brain tumor-like protein 3 isoform X2 [Neodiprion fabricii]XP_046618071.1 lethal(3)malignant brain tumor-like protein 3 isoform X2 [Neodiprion virginianus]
MHGLARATTPRGWGTVEDFLQFVTNSIETVCPVGSSRMEEEIVVDDHIETINGGTHLSGEKAAAVMPLLYIQQGKLHAGQPVSGNQTITASSQSQLASIITPIVTSQNKVFIKSNSQVSTAQNKPHIIIHHHRPITTLSTSSSNQSQKHIVLRKTNTTTAQIVPLQTTQGSQPHAQAGKHTFAYLSNLIKPNKSRETVVIPAGALSTTQVAKPKLVIAPVISQLSQPSSGSTTPVQSQPSKHTTNLLLPVTIPQHSGPAKQGMFNLKINNGQISTDNKGTITVLRESKGGSSGIHPPPLHPLSKMSLLNSVKGKGSSTDGIKITENADSAVITPIPNKDDDAPPEKRKKTISNILRGSGEKRSKKQNYSKSSQDNAGDALCSPVSLDLDHDKNKKRQNDDDITLIKVVPSEDKRLKLDAALDDEIKIEIIKSQPSVDSDAATDFNGERKSGGQVSESKEITSNFHQTDPNFDPAKVLDWQDGVGTLPGSTLKFRMNEFGMMEMVEEEDGKQVKGKNSVDKENVCLSQNSSNASLSAMSADKKKEKKSRPVAADTIYCCESCGCYGLAAEFESPNSCGPSCTEIIEAKKVALIRKEKDLKELRAKRNRKRLLQEQHHRHNNNLEPQQQKEQQPSQSQLQPQSQKPKQQRPQSIESDEQCVSKSETDEDPKYGAPTPPEEIQEDNDSKYPWQTGKLGFSWAKYLEHTKAKAAPVKLFKDAFPYSKNHFKIGMKLEGIDPEHPSHYCVLTVVEVVGYRIRLHFDGYPENYDFWVNADSMDIFPVGWADKNGHKLDPPKGYVASNFSWTAYLKTCKAPAAPKTIFSNKSTLFPNGFRQGMKLEAVDRKHSSLVCVASIAELMDSRILVHFDSWDEVYDYWADASSPYIHPVGWCHHNGHSLTPPNNYKDPKAFTWEVYLRETRSVAAPARAFKQRPPCGFKRGMKLEAVDKRVPQLIRVATVEDVKDHVLKIRFDGWPEHHAYWIDDDAPDIHPMGWCLKTGHPLEPPLTPENLNDRPECGTYGCRGIGHVKGPKYATHNSASGCPYSPQNLVRLKLLPDRLNVKQDSCDFEEDIHDRPKGDKFERIRMERSDKNEKYLYHDDKSERISRVEHSENPFEFKHEKTEYPERSGRFRTNHSDGQTDDDESSKKRKKRRKISEEISTLSPAGYFGDASAISIPYAANIPDKQLRTEIYHSVYNPGYNPLPDAPHIWAKHSNALNRVVAKQNTDPRRWSNEEVIKFIHSVPNCREIGSIFRKNSIDGEAFLMLTQEDLVSLLGLRLGPAIKLYNSIVLLRRRAA